MAWSLFPSLSMQISKYRIASSVYNINAKISTSYRDESNLEERYTETLFGNNSSILFTDKTKLYMKIKIAWNSHSASLYENLIVWFLTLKQSHSELDKKVKKCMPFLVVSKCLLEITISVQSRKPIYLLFHRHLLYLGKCWWSVGQFIIKTSWVQRLLH